MKVYISVDIEGCAGITHWDEARKTHADYPEFREQMTREAVAAIDGARAAGATEILVKDAHSSGRNLITAMLPEDVRLIRSWAGHPLCMVQELDESFDAVLMIGYHSAAGSEANSLAHTLSLDAVGIRINGRPASEFTIHALASSMLGVPTVFVSGDKGLMDEIESVNPHIGRCAVKEGRGQSTISVTPGAACKAIHEGVRQALAGDLSKSLLEVPERTILEITYGDPNLAYRHSWYPGAEHAGNRTIRFETGNYFDVLRMLNYVT
ncbi:MAG: M55 family metallopeptidase [Alphaproteobacteria bacterium]|nr:M55 family metallopeptidase [Alphaproteobacteria bacterium]